MHAPDSLPPGPAGQLIARHGLSLIPGEGAWFALTHVSEERIPAEALPPRYAGTGSRPAGNAILALITRRDFSALHRLRSAETWHFYGGDPAELLLLHPDGRSEVANFGPDSLHGQTPQLTVPAGVWMGARPARDHVDAYTFFGCTLSPGFDYSDYEPGYRAPLTATYPAEAGRITALTREAFLHPPADLAPATANTPKPSPVLTQNSLPFTTIGPGVSLREIVGRAAPGRSENLSLTRFRLEPGATTGSSRYHGADEHFYILSGHGVAEIEDRRTPIGPGDVVQVRRGAAHALTADAHTALEFLALIAPAFNPAHYAPEAYPN
ncbi:MAG: hypothetical protein RL376_216 [Verrucomicrobiota bacterium]